MSDKHDKTWMELAKRARKGERHIISGEAADRMLDELPDEKLAKDDLKAIVEAVMLERPLHEIRGAARSDEVADADGAPETEAVEEDVLQLNRNKGETDEAAEALAEKLRREALEEDEDEDA